MAYNRKAGRDAFETTERRREQYVRDIEEGRRPRTKTFPQPVPDETKRRLRDEIKPSRSGGSKTSQSGKRKVNSYDDLDPVWSVQAWNRNQNGVSQARIKQSTVNHDKWLEETRQKNVGNKANRSRSEIEKAFRDSKQKALEKKRKQKW